MHQRRLQDYAAVTAPTLLIAGSKTCAPARAVVDLLATALPNAKLEILKGAGHMSPFTHPAELNRLIVDYLLGADLRAVPVGQLLDVAGEQLLEFLRLRLRVGPDLLQVRVIL